MKASAIVFAVFLSVTITAELHAQTNDLIIGKWTFDSLKPVGQKDPLSKENLELMVGRGAYKQFFKDGKFNSFDNNQHSFGTWKLVDNNSKIVLTTYRCTLPTYNGVINTYVISKITRDTVVFFVNEKSYMTLIRSKDIDANEDEPLQHKIYVKARAKQIAKRWILKESKSPAETKTFNKQSNRPWFDLKADGTYSRMTLRVKSGRWYFENNDSSIALIDENGEGQLWNIVSVSSDELVIQKPNSDGQQIFEVDLSEKKSHSGRRNGEYSEVVNPN